MTMLWSVVKITLFLAIVAGAAFGANYLLALGGGVQVVMGGQEYNLSPLMAVVALLALMLAIWLLIRLVGLAIAILHFINGDDTALSRYFRRRREAKGYSALAEGVLALASGDGKAAMTQAQKADRYLRKPALTNLIAAQGAEMSGNTHKAEAAYRELIKSRKTRFVGVQGVMRQKLKAGDTETAAKLAQKALELRPSSVEVQDTLLRLQAEKHDWKGARQTLNTKLKQGALPRDVHRRRDAVLALSEARDILDEDKTIEAREAAIEANRLSPDLIPAAIMAARGYLAKDAKRNATRVILKTWKARPHPELAEVFAEIEPGETPTLRLRRFAKLLRIAPDNPESRIVEAELHIAAEDFPGARRAIRPVIDDRPDARALTIMAAIERGEGASETVIKGWLARAVTAPRGPQWVCSNCHHEHADWVPVCESCKSFDTLDWVTPTAPAASATSALGMLPLIVGGPEDEDGPAPDADIAASADRTAGAAGGEIADAEIIATPADDTGPTPRAAS